MLPPVARGKHRRGLFAGHPVKWGFCRIGEKFLEAHREKGFTTNEAVLMWEEAYSIATTIHAGGQKEVSREEVRTEIIEPTVSTHIHLTLFFLIFVF